MCRILIAAGDGEELKKLALAMRSASHRDPYKASRGRGWSHRDGWGYLLMTRSAIQHYRSTEAIFDDSNGFEALMNSLRDGAILMMHSRAASQGKVSLVNTQPFVVSTENGVMAWLVHNGDLNKEAVAEMLDRRPPEGTIDGLSDSYLLAMYLGEVMSSQGTEVSVVKSAMESLASSVRTSLNTMVLTMDGGLIMATVTTYLNPDYARDPKNWNYSRLILLEEPEVVTIASSTLELYYKGPWRAIENGTFVSFEVNRDRLRPETMEFSEYTSR